VLADGEAGKGVVGMVVIWVGIGLIFQSSFVLLTANVGIPLEGKGVIEPLAFKVAFAFLGDIKKFKNTALPPVIARVHQLIGPSVEPSFKLKLPLGHPLDHSI
jgi:hypothetical protein